LIFFLKPLKKIESYLVKIESAIIVLFLFSVVFIATFQIIGRNLFQYTIPGLEVLLRALVLWITFLGASIATTRKRHIAIDALGRVLKPKTQMIVSIITGLLSIFVCILLASASWDFLQTEKQAGAVFVWGLQAWIVELILPIGFLLIGFKFFLKLFDMEKI